MTPHCASAGREYEHAVSRRAAIQVGSIGLLGLGLNHLSALHAEAGHSSDKPTPTGRAKSCIYIFLSGGLAQHDSFDMKPDAPDSIRGEFQPISTRTTGIQICEHLPRLASCSQLWALCRSLTHSSNEHSEGHHIMLTGRSELPPGFDDRRPLPTDWPSIASIAGVATAPKNNLPPSAVLPEKLVHRSRRVIPGQFAGHMGTHRDPWFIEASPFDPKSYGAYPEYQFSFRQPDDADDRIFQAPHLTLPDGLGEGRLRRRILLLNELERQSRNLDRAAQAEDFDQYRQGAISLVTDARVRHALDVTDADERVQERYGKNLFGWSLLMARRLVQTGVNLVQVNLGNNETWDTHGDAFPHLKENLFPPADRAVSALLTDLSESGLLDETLVVMAGEFGRTPRISHLPSFYKLPGRDHWGAVQSVLFAGAGVQGGAVVGSSDRFGAYPASTPQKPENLAATIYEALGIPPTGTWTDDLGRPHHIYHGAPIRELMGGSS